MTNDTWKAYALCAQTDPTIFFPDPGQSTKDAKQTCMACPVRRECLAYALDAEEMFGVWGGVDQTELRRLVRVRQAEAA